MNKIIKFNINEITASEEEIAHLEELCKNNAKLSKGQIKILLRYLAYVVRKKIAEFEGANMKDYSFTYKCDLAQSMICYYLNELGIKANPVNTNEVLTGTIGHSTVVATFNTEYGERNFLIDPTYIQFFTKEKCTADNFYIIDNKVCISPDPGYFIVEDDTKSSILTLLDNGFVEFKEEVAKAYGDSFFQTKQGTYVDQIKNNKAAGADYIKWFKTYTSNLSKSEQDLRDIGLLIRPINYEEGKILE